MRFEQIYDHSIGRTTKYNEELEQQIIKFWQGFQTTKSFAKFKEFMKDPEQTSCKLSLLDIYEGDERPSCNEGDGPLLKLVITISNPKQNRYWGASGKYLILQLYRMGIWMHSTQGHSSCFNDDEDYRYCYLYFVRTPYNIDATGYETTRGGHSVKRILDTEWLE